jgi:A/G-specific adenine glycosylase
MKVQPPTLIRSESARRSFRRTLLRWYDGNRRDLPWRRTRDPYRIWISEIMLQQTRVAAVLEHYRSFLERFPDIHALASATESQILAAWSGLGYYRRARMMLACARQLAKEHAGRLPASSRELQTLSGIGRYTAAAIASIAFSEPVAVVDGNVERVLERVCGRALTTNETWDQAGLLIDESRPGDFNQAMMELGATMCTPRQPDCGKCPIRKWCRTRGEQARRGSSVVAVKKEIWRVLDLKNGRVRLVKRSKRDSLMAGMWELPERGQTAKRRKGTGEDLSQIWRTFRHSITTTNYIVNVVREAGPRTRGRWHRTAEVPTLPITGLTRKILRAAGVI